MQHVFDTTVSLRWPMAACAEMCSESDFEGINGQVNCSFSGTNAYVQFSPSRGSLVQHGGEYYYCSSADDSHWQSNLIHGFRMSPERQSKRST